MEKLVSSDVNFSGSLGRKLNKQFFIKIIFVAWYGLGEKWEKKKECSKTNLESPNFLEEFTFEVQSSTSHTIKC